MVLDIKYFEQRPSDEIPGLADRLLKLIPTLDQHGCSIGSPGGFIERLRRGTWAGHIIEHIAIELQCLAGMEVSFGKTFCTELEGIYIVVFRYKVESAGLKAAEAAVSLFQAIAEEKNFDINQVITDLKNLREDDMLGPSTWSIVKEAQSRNIPFLRLNNEAIFSWGMVHIKKEFKASMTGQTSAIAVEIADEKSEAKEHLRKSGIPVPKGGNVSTLEDALALFDELGTSVVVKPEVGNHGKGSTINITNSEQLKAAFYAAKKWHNEVIVEEFVEGDDFRLLIINGTLVAAAKREPAHVLGDGKLSIKELIDIVNSDPRRGFGHEKVLTQITTDSMTERLLSLKGYSLESIPLLDELIYLKATANLSQGGTATDVTDEVNPEIRLMAERAAKIIVLGVFGFFFYSCGALSGIPGFK